MILCSAGTATLQGKQWYSAKERANTAALELLVGHINVANDPLSSVLGYERAILKVEDDQCTLVVNWGRDIWCRRFMKWLMLMRRL